MAEIRCECGHVNPEGTEICQRCGKPFDESDDILNMRYEGVARRSQTYQKTLIDQVWNFFASVRVGVWLLVITLLASAVGSLLPQEMFVATSNPLEYYTDEYGIPGKLFVILGFHNMYGSWWYITLLILIGVSLTISSIDRGIPLYKSLKRQRVSKHVSFLKRQRIHGSMPLTDTQLQPEVQTDGQQTSVHGMLDKVKKQLVKQRYNVREEGRAVLGEKGRFSRWGPYIVHVGLIILLIGALIRFAVPNFMMDEYMWVRDGETAPVPGTDGQFYLKSEGFELERYELEENQFMEKDFRTDAILYENVINEETGESELQEVKRHLIEVNHPLEYKTLRFYQYNYREDQLSKFSFNVEPKEGGEPLGQVTVDLYDPDPLYDLGDGYEVELIEYYPDFEMDQNRQPVTRGETPLNPAFIFEVRSPDNPRGEKSWIFLGQRVEMPGEEHEYQLSISDVTFSNVTGLSVRKELSLPIIFTGLSIAMIGLVLCFYWQHRRIWVQQEDDRLWIAAHTNKNWFGMRKEVEHVIDGAQLNIDKTMLDQEAVKDQEAVNDGADDGKAPLSDQRRGASVKEE